MYGYGGKEETLYLKALELAQSGSATLLFSFESDKSKLLKILTSYATKTPIIKLENGSEEYKAKLQEFQSSLDEVVPLSYCDAASMDIKEIEDHISRAVKDRELKHVVLDRVDNLSGVLSLGRKYKVEVIF
ncbi:DnaB-like helicase C-terminal domain-containing protein [Paenibacillus luteus]|uniref:DnaB-like helicase C-terminal domain-containing protein n=1 Tax=Paenibacillus luteus TaxID=2545753 RepID=UPI00114256E0|nr:DnaB-like helicase C-terminal domain-containing protein [Paenibacillus luteus]